MTAPTACVKLGDYEKTGLYLIPKDSTRLVLTEESIERVTSEYWMNSDKIPARVKEAVEFQRCPFCPLKKNEDLCDALRPVLPLLDVVDEYVSFDEVLAVYKSEDGSLHIIGTSMQEALKYISTLSLMRYCQIGRQYWKYYYGIMPLTSGEEFIDRLYQNIYWHHGGDRERVDRLISEFHSRIAVTSKNQVTRLRLICKNDAFMNAFISAQSIIDLLELTKGSRQFGEPATAPGSRDPV